MSYSRFSSDDWSCDLYIYADVSGGWTIHVAGNRINPEVEIPSVPQFIESDPEGWLEKYNAQMEVVDKARRVHIDLPHAGETFHEPTPEATLDRVRELRALGYRCPDRVEERLLEDAVEEGA